MILFFKSFALGFLVAAPVGPIAMLVLQRSLQIGSLAGVASGIGAALADALLALLAGLGLAAVLQEIQGAGHLVGGIGGFVLIGVGVKFFFQKPSSFKTEEVLSERYLHHYLWDAASIFLLTLTNPMTILAFAALYAGSSLIPLDPRRLDFFRITLGVFCGSFGWWMILVLLAQPIRRNLSPLRIHRLLEGVGMVLIILGGLSFVPRLGTLIDKIPILNGIF